MGDTQPPDPQINGGPLVVSSETVGSKRQRRPSVRLGDIGGDQPPYDSYSRRTNKDKDKPWKLSFDHPRDSSAPPKNSSKTRPLINLTSSEDKENNLDSLAIGSWRLKDSKTRPPPPTKRLRSNWVSSKNDQGSAAEDVDDAFRDYDMDNSTSPLKEQSPLNSTDNLAIQPRSIRSRDRDRDRDEFSVPSDTDGGNWKCGDTNGTGCEDGVKVWLNGLGLGRYAPVFEIHEVDDEVLPMLTLEDLKDMGINAVGSRRKMFSAILKLGKGFS